MHDHGVECWHDLPHAETNRRSWEQICCHCGMTRTVTVTRKRPEGHGPYVPDEESATEIVTYSDERAP